MSGAGPPTPALVLDLDVLEANIATAMALARKAGVSLRPHAKTHKSPHIARLLADAGAVGACVATLGEAAALAAAGIRGLLLTAPVATSEQLDRLAALVAGGADLMAVCDHPDVAARLSAAVTARGAALRCLIDIDVGQGRTGVISAFAALDLARTVETLPGLTLVGVQAYWGHLQQVPEVAERGRQVKLAAGRLKAVVEALRRTGSAPEIVTGGGTGTLGVDRGLGLFTELQAGSFLVLDSLYGPLPILPDGTNPFRHSLFVRAAVVSANSPGNTPARVTVNAGLKALATDSGRPLVWSGAPREATYRFTGDEHGALDLPPGTALVPGDEVELVPSHCDPTVNLYPCYHVRRGGEWVGRWPVVGRYGEG